MSGHHAADGAAHGDDLLRRAGRVFDEVIGLEPPARRARIAVLCAGDAELEREVESLLQAASSAEQFLNQPAAGAWMRTPDATPTTLEEGGHIGSYRLLERLGEGGFGVVYLAEQREPVHRRVALKVVKLGMDSRAVVARFEAERQALALLDHPHIARIYDAGTTASGRPYFVMEYVRGDPITTYCDRHRLALNERVRLMVRVCEAVQHAHQKGIIHRDLKPSNVLVTEIERRPEPKVIDFGIAKAMHQRLTEKTLYTERGQLIGTPAYMSPEQAAQGGVDVDTRTDVYSLGVMLYELLAGSPPFDPQAFASGGVAEVQRVIREVDPPRPSTRLAQTPTSLAAIAAARAMDGRALQRSLHGELDWITMKALEKDRVLRYGSAADLARDLTRYLSSEPVLAGPPRRWYVAKKFVRRHRLFVVSGIVIVALLVHGLIGTSLGLLSEQRAKAEAVAATARAEAVNRFLREMLASPDPTHGFHHDVRVREVLDHAARKVSESFASQPDVEAALEHTIGATYRMLGEFKLAEAHLNRARELRLSTQPHSLEMADVELEVGLLYLDTARLTESEQAMLRARDLYREQVGEASEAFALALDSLGDLEVAMGRFADAEVAFRDALAIVRNGVPRSSLEGGILLDQANLLERLSRYDDAESVLREAQQIEAEHGVNAQPRLLRIQDMLALLRVRNGDLHGALVEYRRALELAEKRFGEDHLEVANRQCALAEVLQQVDQLDEALELFSKAIATYRLRMQGGSPALAKQLTNLAWVHMRKAKPEVAEPLLREALAMSRALLGARHPDVGHTLSDLGILLREKRELVASDEALSEALSIFEEAFGEHHLWTVIAMHGLSETKMDRGDLAAAIGLLDRACDLAEDLLPPENWQYCEFHKRRGECLIKLKRFDEAEEELERVYTYISQQFGADHRRTVDTVKAMLDLLIETERWGECASWRARLPRDQREYGLNEERRRRSAKARAGG